jgi:hypothetical protein
MKSFGFPDVHFMYDNTTIALKFYLYMRTLITEAVSTFQSTKVFMDM